jgi:hypothetical protein
MVRFHRIFFWPSRNASERSLLTLSAGAVGGDMSDARKAGYSTHRAPVRNAGVTNRRLPAMEPLLVSRTPMMALYLMLLLSGAAAQTPDAAPAKTETKPSETVSVQKPTLDVYGFAQMDAGYDFRQVDPDWFDVLRPVKLPAFKDQFGANGNTYFSVRQSRFGVKSDLPTQVGVLKTVFEFELLGTGVDAGQTTFRLRHAYGELGHFAAGQTWSAFMDIDIFPNTVEYWGPNGMVLFRNVQFRWMPVQGQSRIVLALERPGASADQGVYANRIELQDVTPHFPAPDLTGHARLGRSWGHVQIAGVGRRIEWKDKGTDQYDLSGGTWGWGVNLTSNLKTHKDKDNGFKLGIVYGKGIQNYMNDAPEDIGIRNNPDNPKTPVVGIPLPMLGISAFYDFYLSSKFSSTIGYSRLHIDNSDGQASSAYRTGQYASTNLLYYPVKNAMAGAEFVYGYRNNFRDGWSVPDYRLQFSFKYNYSFRLGGD